MHTAPMIIVDWRPLLLSGAVETLDAAMEWVRTSPRPRDIRVLLPRLSPTLPATSSVRRQLQSIGCTVTQRR